MPDFDLKLAPRLFRGGEKCFGPGAAELLEGVDRDGSLRAAAAHMGMAYSKAWTTLRNCEKTLDSPLLTRETGGKGGGGARLTPQGRALLEGYRRLERELDAAGALLLRQCIPGVGGVDTAEPKDEKRDCL